MPATGIPTHGDADALTGGTHTPIDDRTITPDWCGERLDLDLALAYLVPELMPAAA